MSEPCRCACGYTCGRKCGLPLMECMEAHYRRDCDHKFDGPMEEWETPGGGRVGTVTCSKCGVDAFSHDLAVGP